MTPSRSSIRGSIATVVLLACAAPVSAQSSAGAFALAGMSHAALWTSGATSAVLPSAGVSSLSTVSGRAGVASPLFAAGRTFLPDTRIGVAPSASRTTAQPPQAQDGGGGFPWLEVGIGAAVGVLFIQAVATANSGDAAALPRGGVSVVLPSS
jgi:hypothetical protein